MKKQEILTKAIEKAIEGGWTPPDEMEVLEYEYKDYKKSGFMCLVLPITPIFSHDFLKAFFGEREHDIIDEMCFEAIWQYHGYHMLISEDPIKYLEDYI